MALPVAELGGGEGAHDLVHEGRTEHARTEGQHGHVVVLDALVRGVGVVTDGGAHARDLAGGDGRADARAADQHAAVGLTARDGHGDAFRDIGIVDGLAAVGASVADGVAERLERGDDAGLEREAGVIGPDDEAPRVSQQPPASDGLLRAARRRAPA